MNAASTLLRLALGLSLVAVLSAGSAAAQATGDFEPVLPSTPSGALLVDIARPGDAWLLSGGGPWLTDDGGASWLDRSSTLDLIDRIAIDEDAPERLWGFSSTRQFARSWIASSEDGGRSWRRIDVPFIRGPADIDLGDEGLYVLAPDVDANFYRSTDGGRSWVARDGARRHIALEVLPGQSPTGGDVLVALDSEGIDRSIDSGVSFTRVAELVEGQYEMQRSTADPRTVYVVELGTGFDEVTAFLRSTDAAQTWADVELPAGVFLRGGVADDPADASHLVAISGDQFERDLYESFDGGTTWVQASPPPETGRFFDVAIVDGSVLLRSTESGTWRRDPAGVWSRVEILGAGFTGPLAVDPFEPGHLLVTDRRGLARSSDGGATWQRIALDAVVDFGLDPEQVWSLADYEIEPGGALWLIVQVGPISPSDRRLFRSDDDGATWVRKAEGFGRIDAKLLLPGRFPGHMRLVLSPDERPELDRGVWRTVDGGETFELELSTADTAQRVIDFDSRPLDPEALYLLFDAGLMRVRLGEEAPWRSLSTPVLREISVGVDGRIYGRAFNQELQTSADDGATWTEFALFPGRANELLTVAASPLVPGLAFAGDERVLLVTRDGGRTWVRHPAVATSGVRSARFDGAAGQRLWLSTPADGLRVGFLDDPVPLTLQGEGGRFAVEVSWRDFEGNTGTGTAASRTGDTGTFWFFGPENLELMVKILDGRPVNDHWWVFFGALSNVEFTIEITDLRSGERQIYDNPLGTFASFGDVELFFDPLARLVGADSAPSRSPLMAPLVSPVMASSPSASSLVPAKLRLDDDRFEASVTWRDFEGNTGTGQSVPLADDTGAFWFFGPENLEMMVKVLDGRAVNGKFWVFYGALTNVEFTLRIVDTVTGAVYESFNPLGTFASVGDVDAFDP